MGWKWLLVLCLINQGIQGEAIQLGKPFSILNGFKPEFPGASSSNLVFYEVQNGNVFTNVNKKVVSTDINYFGPDIELTYHADAYDLLKTFFSMWHFEDETRDAAGYIFSPQDTKATLASLLGISEENAENKVYVLARYLKILSSTTMTSGDLTGLTSSSISADATVNDITGLFAQHGTHYVSGYQTGDMIYQVFVYDQADAELIKRVTSNPGISGTVDFRQYTQLKSVGTHGICVQAGTIKSASGDAALARIIPQLNDNVYQVKQSILMFLTGREKYELADQLSTTIPIKLFFKPIINKLTSVPKAKWNKILSVAVFQKFGPISSPGFPTITDNHAVSIYDSFNPDLVTQTATNYVTITRMTFNLDEFSVSDPEFVTHLFIFADVLRISTGTLELPGTVKIFLICREFISLSSGNKVPEIIVGLEKGSSPALKIVAKQFRGILKVTHKSSGAHFTYDDENVYKTIDEPNIPGQTTVRSDNAKKLTYPDSRTLPELYSQGSGESFEATWLSNSLVYSVELLVTTSETISTVRSNTDSVDVARKTLNWITDTLTRSTQGSSSLAGDLEVVLGRALLIVKTQLVEFARTRVIVPRLAFAQYRRLYESLLAAVSSYEMKFQQVSNLINQRKMTETVTTTLTELNANVKSIGGFLVEQAEVNAKYQDDVSKTNEALHKLEKDRISREQGKADKLLQEIISEQEVVKTAGDTLKAALEQYQKEQIAAAFLNVAQVIGSLFTGAVGLGNIDEKLTGIVRVAEKINNVVTIIEQVSKLYDLGINMRNDIGTINRALDNIPSPELNQDSFPTELEWNDFDTDVTAYTSTSGFLPGQVAGEALDFQRAAKRLSSRGREYVATAANIANIKYKQIQIEMQRDLAKRQSSRLRTLKATLTQSDLSENDAKTTDLFEIGNIIKMKGNQVRSQLVQTFAVMDAALQYQYFQEPTLITNFDTMTIQHAAVTQIQSSISALENLDSRPVDLPQPIVFDVPGVPVRDLLSDIGYKVTIPLTSRPFRDYVRVRILNFEVRADHITTSANDTVYIQAVSSGENFMDRDLNRNRRHYSTTPTEHRYVYNFATSETLVPVNPGEEFTSKFIKITPFDDWIFRFPNVTTNRGLQFSTQLTTLRIKFYVNVIFNPPSNSDGKKRRFFQKTSSGDVGGSKDDLLSQMNGRSLLKNWDAIMAVNAKRVNDIWQQQYDSGTNAGFVRNVVTERSVSSETRRRKTETSLNLGLGPPRIQFLVNNQNRATLTIKIKSFSIEYWETSKRDGFVDHYTETYDTDDNSIITANMNLQKLRGTLTEESKVVLDLSNGVFDVANLDLASSDLMGVRNSIQAFFTTQLKSSDYELAKVTYEKSRTPRSLVPDKFYLSTGGFTESSLGTLYIFIRTHSPGAAAIESDSRDFNDPLSISDQIIPNDYEVALFIHNRIIFEDIIEKEIERRLGFGAHSAVLPGQSSLDQQSKYVQGDSNAEKSLPMTLEYDRDKDQYFTFTMPGNTLTAKSKNNGRQIEVHWVNSGLRKSIPYPDFSCGRTMCREFTSYSTVTFDTRFVNTFTPAINNELTITYNIASATGSGSSSASSWDSFWNRSTFKEARKQITSKVNNYMQGLKNFNFRSISAFALTQVVFPNQNVFRFTDVYIPGDMLILGNVALDPNVRANSKKSRLSKFKKSTESKLRNLSRMRKGNPYQSG